MPKVDYLKEEYHSGRHWGLEDRSKIIVLFFERYADKNDTILELGCSEGRNLKFLKKAGYKNLTGLEMSPVAIKNAKGFKMIPKRFEDVDLEEYDIIFSASFLQEFTIYDKKFPEEKLKEAFKKAKKYFFIFGDAVKYEELSPLYEGVLEEVERINIPPFTQPTVILKRI